MIQANPHYEELERSYLFSEIARRVAKWQAQNPTLPLLRLGIGDVTEPLAPPITKALVAAAREMGTPEGFRGYGPEQGYPWLRETIAKHDFQARGAAITADEVFVSDGAKSDTANILDILGRDLTIAVQDPVYPVYVDTNVMVGRAGAIRRLTASEENDFLPGPDSPGADSDVIYLCYPNNPTGVAADRELLTAWVRHALDRGSLLLFDAAYAAFVRDDRPLSIYEIPGAERCAIELRSFSKTAGFTGLRCGYTVVPHALEARGAAGTVKLRDLWLRRQTTKFNGVAYPVQRAAEAVYSEAGQQAVREQVAGYLANVDVLRQSLEKAGYKVAGGRHAPYLWVRVEGSSWDAFDDFLERLNLVITPGSGFGAAGEGYIRVSAFGSAETVARAARRLETGRVED
ncbi:MAG: LL-diaminopimelate aminotransferase [Bacillota bacterium]|nr:LL-diaminopimelate aminotransferase [Bacillota bacterium]